MTRSVRYCWLLLLVASPLWADEADEREQTRAADRQIQLLGHGSYEVREGAMRALLEIGGPAWEGVYAASRESSDLEIRFRARELLFFLERPQISEQHVLKDHREIVHAVAFSPDGRYLATAGGDTYNAGLWSKGEDCEIRVWDLESGRVVARLTGHTGSVKCLAWSRDGALLASGSADSTARLWDVAAKKQAAAFVGHRAAVTGIALASDHRLLVTGAWDGRVHVWDIASKKVAKTFDRGQGRVWDIALSPDDATVAVVGDAAPITLWSLAHERVERMLEGHTGNAVRAAWSPDGTRLVSGAWDGTARVWNVKTGQAIVVLGPPQRFGEETIQDPRLRLPDDQRVRVEGVAFTPDGEGVYTGSLDGQMRLWDAQRGDQLRTYATHRGPVSRLAVSADGRFVASGCWDGQARVWKREGD